MDFELDELEMTGATFLDFLLDFLLLDKPGAGLTTMTPRANFCSLDKRGGGGGERR